MLIASIALFSILGNAVGFPNDDKTWTSNETTTEVVLEENKTVHISSNTEDISTFSTDYIKRRTESAQEHDESVRKYGFPSQNENDGVKTSSDVDFSSNTSLNSEYQDYDMNSEANKSFSTTTYIPPEASGPTKIDSSSEYENDGHVLILRKACKKEKLLRVVEQNTDLLQTNAILNCNTFISIQVSVKNSSIDEAIEEIQTKTILNRQNFEVVKVFQSIEDYNKAAPFYQETLFKPCDGEIKAQSIMTYFVTGAVSIGIVCALILTTFFINHLCRKKTNSLTMYDVPHLNLKLADYKLTPIPRPTVSIQENNHDVFKAYNENYTYRSCRIGNGFLTQPPFSINGPKKEESVGQDGFSQELRAFGSKKPFDNPAFRKW